MSAMKWAGAAEFQGGTFNPFILAGGITALANGNYVVSSPTWNNSRGAVTWGNGATGISGSVSSTNSLVGSTGANSNAGTPGDQVGGGFNSDQANGVTALSNGNYVVLSTYWSDQNGVGAATWGDGVSGVTGPVSSANSLIDLPDVNVVNGTLTVATVPNGDYFVINNPGTGTADNPVPHTNLIATWANGFTGKGLDGISTPDIQNTMSGYSTAIQLPNGLSIYPALGPTTSGLPMGFTDPNLLQFNVGEGQTITVTPDFVARTLAAGIDVTIEANDDLVIASPIVVNDPNGTPGQLTLKSRPQHPDQREHRHRRWQPDPDRQRLLGGRRDRRPLRPPGTRTSRPRPESPSTLGAGF